MSHSPPPDGYATRLDAPLSDRERSVIAEVAGELRTASWDIAVVCVDIGIEQRILPALEPLGTVKRLANLPAFIGGLATSIARPRPGRRFGSNPVLARIARDHVVERERVGFSAREIVHEFLLLRRVVSRFVQHLLGDEIDARTLLRIEDLLNTIIDEVIAECTVIYVERATQELSEKSRRDSLTKLLNHQALHTKLDIELDRCRRYGHELQVIYFDLDDFKIVNDTLGHATGDQVLRVVSEVIQESIRESDFAGRMGGDEFVIGLVESSDLAAHLMLDRIRARMAQRGAQGDIPPGIGISAGCASFPSDADDAPDLLVLADRRQYEDKRARKSADGDEPSRGR